MTDVKVQAELELKNAAKTKKKAEDIGAAFAKLDKTMAKARKAQEKLLKDNIKRATLARQLIDKRNRKAAAEAEQQIKKINAALSRLGKSAQANLGRMGSLFSGIGSSMRRARSGSNTLMRNLIAIGATYVGIHALTNALQGLSRTFIGVNSRVEDTTLSIASLLSEIEQTPSFNEATRQANGLYRQMELLAVSSPGTAENISDAFTMALGPMRRAGVGMQDILTFSRDAVAVASALRIDMPQVARDISMMATGVAGTDVRTFRVLRSMGMITETTEEWNRMALERPAEAAQRMIDIYQQLGEQSAAAFGRTWSGISSAFQDITSFFGRAFTGPGFRRIRDELGRVNEFLLKYRSGIEKVLTAFGGRFARVLGRIARIMATTFARINDNLESIAARFDQIVATFQRLRPIFRTMLIAGIGLKVAGAAIAAAFTVVGTAFSVLGPVVGALAPLLGGGGLAGVAGGGGLLAALGIGGGGAVAAGGAAATAATGGIAAIAALAAAVAVVTGALAGLAVLGTVIASVFTAISRNGQRFMVYMTGIGQMFREIGDNIWSSLVGVWRFISPILETLGFIIVGVVIAGFRVFASVLLHVSRIARVVGGVLAIFGAWLSPLMVQMRLVFHALFTSLRSFAAVLNQFVSWLPGATGMAMPSVTTEGAPTGRLESAMRGIIEDFRTAMQPRAQPGQEGAGGTGTAPPDRPGDRPIDMRGSRIEVNQEFRDADPDRVWMQMREGFEREAIQRTTSGFVNPFTR